MINIVSLIPKWPFKNKYTFISLLYNHQVVTILLGLHVNLILNPTICNSVICSLKWTKPTVCCKVKGSWWWAVEDYYRQQTCRMWTWPWTGKVHMVFSLTDYFYRKFILLFCICILFNKWLYVVCTFHIIYMPS